MKYKKGILIVSSILIFFIYIGGTLLQQRLPIANSIPPVIRFHVRANSDTKEDQALKLEVRDAILTAIGEKFQDSTSIDESREIILENTKTIEDVSKEVIKRWGKDYPVNVDLREESFPIRKYGNLVFPQGDYEALIVEIGEAKGANWWCVMFPPICLVDVTHSNAIEIEEDEDSPLNEFVVDETRPFKLKSKIFDFFKPFFTKDKTKEV
ncbi:stage II sporulation protein R [Tissierella creatinophila]|uniref:Stage II sporulation protein SpoIIR n=1 Tax=Tissierella creatinophila DSM 6911 TaxID=1123403 RepID=A0A1U7M4Q2_TISCR|nr:stage II sporulation protein R [Tissierella creatinophila]OLS02271.1 stage II sporulation protein SpoIIR [Tissierella creatinophila DSM 6911]